MGQIGLPELMIIFVIALLVFGPKKLPDLGKSLGKALSEFKRATSDLKSSWEEQMRDAEAGLEEATKEVKDVDKDLKAEFYSSELSQPKK